jgi:hypothetical protein
MHFKILLLLYDLDSDLGVTLNWLSTEVDNYMQI